MQYCANCIGTLSSLLLLKQTRPVTVVRIHTQAAVAACGCPQLGTLVDWLADHRRPAHRVLVANQAPAARAPACHSDRELNIVLAVAASQV